MAAPLTRLTDEEKRKQAIEEQEQKRLRSDEIISGIIEKEARMQASFPKTSASFIIQDIDRNHTNDRQFFQLGISMEQLKESDGIGFRYHPDRAETFNAFKKKYLTTSKWDPKKLQTYKTLAALRGGGTDQQKEEFMSLENELVKEYQKHSVPIHYFQETDKGNVGISYSDVLDAARELSERLLADPKKKQTLRRRLAERARGYQNLNERLVVQATCPEKECGLNHMNDPEFQSMGFSMYEIKKRFHIFFKAVENERGEITEYRYFVGDLTEKLGKEWLVDYRYVKQKVAILYGQTKLQELYYQQVGSPARGLPLVKSVSLVQANPWCHVRDPDFYQYCVSMQEIYDALGYTFIINWKGDTLDSNIEYFDLDGNLIGKSQIINAAYMIAIRRAINPVKNPNIPKMVDCFTGDSNIKCVGSKPVYVEDYLPNFITEKDIHVSLSEMERYGYQFDVGLNVLGVLERITKTAARMARAAFYTIDWDHLKNAPIAYSRIVIPYRLNHVKGMTHEGQDEDWLKRYYVSSEAFPEKVKIDVVGRKNAQIKTRLENIDRFLKKVKTNFSVKNVQQTLVWLACDNRRYKGIYSISQNACENLCKYTSLMLDVFEGIFYKKKANLDEYIEEEQLSFVMSDQQQEHIFTWIDGILRHVKEAIKNPTLVEGDDWANAGEFFSDFFFKFVNKNDVQLWLFHGIINISDVSFWKKFEEIDRCDMDSYDEQPPSTIFKDNKNIITKQDRRLNSVFYENVEYEIPRLIEGQIPPPGYHSVSIVNIMEAAKLIEIANEIQAKPLNQVAKKVLGSNVKTPVIEQPQENHTTLNEANREIKNSVILRFRDGSSHFPLLNEGKYPIISGLYFRLAYYFNKDKRSKSVPGSETENIITYMLRIETAEATYAHIPIPYSFSDQDDLATMVRLLDGKKPIAEEMMKKFIITGEELETYGNYIKNSAYAKIFQDLTVKNLAEKVTRTETQKLVEMIGVRAGKNVGERLADRTATYAKSLGYSQSIVSGSRQFSKGNEKVSYPDMEKRFLNIYFKDDFDLTTPEERRQKFLREEKQTDKEGNVISTKFLKDFNEWIKNNTFPINTRTLGLIDTKIFPEIVENINQHADYPRQVYRYYRYTKNGEEIKWWFLDDYQDNDPGKPPFYSFVNDKYIKKGVDPKPGELQRKELTPQELGVLREEFTENYKYRKSVEKYNKVHPEAKVRWEERKHKLVMTDGKEATDAVKKAFMCIRLPNNALSIVKGSVSSSSGSSSSGSSSSGSSSSQPQSSAVPAAPGNFLESTTATDSDTLNKVKTEYYKEHKANGMSLSQFTSRYDQAKNEGRLKPLKSFSEQDLKKIKDEVSSINDLLDFYKEPYRIYKDTFPWDTAFGYFFIALAVKSSVFEPEPDIAQEDNDQDLRSNIKKEDIFAFNKWLQNKGKNIKKIPEENLQQVYAYWDRIIRQMPVDKAAIDKLFNDILDEKKKKNPNLNEFEKKCAEMDSKLQNFSQKYGEDSISELKSKYQTLRKDTANLPAVSSSSSSLPSSAASSSSTSSTSSSNTLSSQSNPEKTCIQCGIGFKPTNPTFTTCGKCHASSRRRTEPLSQLPSEHADDEKYPQTDEEQKNDVYSEIERKIRAKENFDESNKYNQSLAEIARNTKKLLEEGYNIRDLFDEWDDADIKNFNSYLDL